MDSFHKNAKKRWLLETRRTGNLKPHLLVTAETIGIAKIMTCEDYSNLQRQFRVNALVLQIVKILKSRLQKNVATQKELTSQAAETVAETSLLETAPNEWYMVVWSQPSQT